MEKDNPLITIAIASYNNAPYIERCIDSVLCQLYDKLEIIIVDDGSTDNSLALCSKYLVDKRVKLLSKNNGGLSSVRQRALDEATGAFICFIDADDYLLPSYIENMLEKIIEDGSDVCLCSTRFELPDGTLLDDESRSFECQNSEEPIRTYVNIMSEVNNEKRRCLKLSDSWNKMYRVSSIIMSNVRFSMPKGLNGSDLLFNRVLALHDLSYSLISEVGYVHVIYPNSAVRRKNKKLYKTYENLVDALLNESEKLHIADRMKRVISYDYEVYQLNAIEDIYDSSSGFCQCCKLCNSVFQRYSKYLNKRNLDKICLKDIDGCTVKLFYILYHKARLFLPLYFWLMNKCKRFK